MSAVAMDGGVYDLYADLGLAQKIRSSEQEIRKAYREKALQCHPDKRRGDAEAAGISTLNLQYGTSQQKT